MQLMIQSSFAGKGGGGKEKGGVAKGNGGKTGKDKSTIAWVGNIPEGISEEEIKENFSQAGTIKSVKINRKREGFVEFTSAAEVQQAIAMFNGAEVGSSTLQV